MTDNVFLVHDDRLLEKRYLKKSVISRNQKTHHRFILPQHFVSVKRKSDYNVAILRCTLARMTRMARTVTRMARWLAH